MLEARSGTKFQLLPLFNIVGPFLGLTRNLRARHLWWVFLSFFLSFTFLSSRKSSFYHQESSYYLQIKHNRKFLHKVNNFVMVLVFFSFRHNPNEIPKEKVEKQIKECVVGVNV